MKEFVLVFRMDITTGALQPTPEQMEIYMTQWMEWINEIAKQKQLASGGNHFSPEGRVLKSQNKLSNEPYTVNKETVVGYIIILAKDIDDAVRIARKCPILAGEGTSVEVRETATPGSMNTVERTKIN